MSVLMLCWTCGRLTMARPIVYVSANVFAAGRRTTQILLVTHMRVIISDLSRGNGKGLKKGYNANRGGRV